jgi:transmembrane sensor
MELPEKLWHLMARVLNSEASSAEQAELFEQFAQNPHLQQQYELLKRVWKEKEDERRDEEQAKQYILKIINKAETKIDSDLQETVTRHRRRRRVITISSFALIMIITATWWFMGGSPPARELPVALVKNEAVVVAKEASLVAPRGSRISSILPDGSMIWLNAGSKLYFENDFKGSTREVRLEGEGYFDIVKKQGQPFIVHTSSGDVHVLGTAFNVKAYPEDGVMETTLYRGLVEVSLKKNNSTGPISLKPNEKLVIQQGGYAIVEQNDKPVITARPDIIITRIDSTKKENEQFETAWRYSRLEFRGDNFETLARKMERWYNVEIAFKDEQIKSLSFDGSFEKETIEEAFAALNEVGVFHYEINKNEILISSPE